MGVCLNEAFRGAWQSLIFYKEYLFGFETLVFATSGISYMYKRLVAVQREKLEIASYDPFNLYLRVLESVNTVQKEIICFIHYVLI